MKRKSGIMIVMLLIALLIVAWLTISNMKSSAPGNESGSGDNLVEQAQNAVDTLNDRLNQYDANP